jgi:cobyrinic acid a,c-diamide synthase
VDALYLGGGFPEINLRELAANIKLKKIIKELAEDGLPVYAECGGLMYLSNTITWKGEKYSLAGLLPVDIVINDKPSGHGYSRAVVDRDNAFFDEGTVIKGHEFHYSEITNYDPWIKTSLSVERGTGSIEKRDGLVYKNVFASYIHVHAVASPEWAKGMIKAAKNFKTYKNSKILIEG